MSQATEALGLGDDTIALLVTGDDLGLCHASNAAIFSGLPRVDEILTLNASSLEAVDDM